MQLSQAQDRAATAIGTLTDVIDSANDKMC
jgi:hypothetical protein